MKTLLNIIWLIFGGLGMFLGYLGAGVIAAIFIITLPISVVSFRIAKFVIWPFGQSIVRQPGAGAGSTLMNIVWFFIAGIWLAVGHLLSAVALTLTIIGIPLAIVHIKLIPVSCFPFGKMVVPSTIAGSYDVVVTVN
ncbi:YccF domain-containing protein [Arcanobacterium pinnipediorum]|uniref:YccF domain-containing protein n=1 Tax=Arcanobacterium pinnipediorum TaxID=1503041 RepID=A0ABY5AIM3_9ACTO|nr:YccF domain-containing protein [Arcanobacterium pinnipediorum]USR79291.1 YccF domain-containing protein [Arcanobacterium pinnipediorum]